MCLQLAGGLPGGPNVTSFDITCGAETATQLPSLEPCYVTPSSTSRLRGLCHNYQALLHFAVLSNDAMSMLKYIDSTCIW